MNDFNGGLFCMFVRSFARLLVRSSCRKLMEFAWIYVQQLTSFNFDFFWIQKRNFIFSFLYFYEWIIAVRIDWFVFNSQMLPDSKWKIVYGTRFKAWNINLNSPIVHVLQNIPLCFDNDWSFGLIWFDLSWRCTPN